MLKPEKGVGAIALLTLFSIGEKHDPLGKSGMAHLLEHLYITAATKNIPARTVDEFAANYPLGWNAQTGLDYTVFAAIFPADQLDRELSAAKERLNLLQIRESDLQREIPRIAHELLNMHQIIPVLVAQNLAYQILYQIQRGGRIQEIQSISLSEINQRIKTYYKPVNTIMVLAGDFDADALRVVLETEFSDIDSGSKLNGQGKQLPSSLPTQVTRKIPFSSVQFHPQVAMAIKTPAITDPLFPAFLITMTRFYQNSTHLCQVPEVFPVMYAPLDKPEMLILQLPVQPKETSTMIKSKLQDFINTTVAEKFNLKEVELTKQLFGNSLGLSAFRVKPDAGQLYTIAFCLGRLKQMNADADQLLQQLEATTSEEFVALKTKYFSEDSWVTVIIEKE